MPHRRAPTAGHLAGCLLVALLPIVACLPRSELPRDTPRVPAGLSGHLLLTRKDALETLDLGTGRLAVVASAPSGARISSGRWSPTGGQFVYAVAPEQTGTATRSTLFVAAADGSGARAVVSAESPGVFYHWPTWDAAGTHLFTLRADRSGARIEEIDVTSGEARPVVDRAADFDVSRDGRLLAFVRNGDAGATLNLVDRDAGGAPQVLLSTRPLQVIAAPRFTPDGSALLFSLARLPEGQSWTESKRHAVYWGGIGVALAHGLPQDIYSIPVAGGPPLLLVRLGADDPVATWSPEADRLAVLTITSLGIASPGGSIVPILAPGGYGSVDWRP